MQQWQTVNMLYQDTDKNTLAEADQFETLIDGQSRARVGRCSMFLCRHWHDPNGTVHAPGINDGRPTISPYASNRVVIPATEVFGSPDDFLIPIHYYPDPSVDPDRSYRSSGGNTCFEMVYVRREDIVDATPDNVYLQGWQLWNHPFIQYDGQSIRYRVIHNHWWLILTPYKVPIPANATWESVRLREGEMNEMNKGYRIRTVYNPVTLELVRNLSAFNS